MSLPAGVTSPASEVLHLASGILCGKSVEEICLETEDDISPCSGSTSAASPMT